MNVIQCAAKGIREATSRPKLVLVLWAFNILVAGLGYVVFLRAFGDSAGRGLPVQDLTRAADMTAAIEFLTSQGGGAIAELIVVALGLCVLYALASVFLYGGILQTLIQKGGGWRFSEIFFAGGGRFYGRFFRLEIYALALWLAAGLFYAFILTIIDFNYRDLANEQTALVLTVIRVLLAIFLVFLIKMIRDYARILVAGRDSREVLGSLLEAVQFVAKKPLKTLSLYYVLGLVGWVALIFYKLLGSTFPRTSTAAVVAGFLLAQVFIASRGWLKVAYQASQGRLIGLI